MSQRYTGGVSLPSSFSVAGAALSTSVCAWAYVTSDVVAGDFGYADAGHGLDNGNAIWLGFEPGFWRFQNRESGVGYDYSHPIALNSWHHLAMTWDFPGATAYAYVDGALVNSAGLTLPGRGRLNYFDIGFGGDFTVQDVMFFRYALTQAQIRTIMTSMVAPISGPLTAYTWWKLSNASPTADEVGSRPLDVGGNANGTQIIIAAQGNVRASGAGATSGSVSLAAVGTVRASGAVFPTTRASLLVTGNVASTGAVSADGIANITVAGTTRASGGAATSAAIAISSVVGTTRASGNADASTGGVTPFPNPPAVGDVRRLSPEHTGRRNVRR